MTTQPLPSTLSIVGAETSARGTVDAHGNPMSASRESAALYNRAVDALLRYGAGLLEHAGALAEHAADVPMAQAMLAYLSLSTTDVPDLPAARGCLEALRALPKNERETMHAAAIAAWLAGDWVGASDCLDEVLQRWPADLLALLFGHQLDFFMGDNLALRDRVCRSLPAVDPTHPHYGFVRGMQAFGLEEAGSYAQATDAAAEALAINPDDVWALHAMVHVFEMQGRVDEGTRFMADRVGDWGSGNLFTVHNWWHRAMFALEAGQQDEMLVIYDREIHHADSPQIPLQMLDASALLWRMRLDGIDTGDRFDALSRAWSTRTWCDPWYVFNDVHAVMALAGAGRLTDARAVVTRLVQSTTSTRGTNAVMTAEVGLPSARALVAHAEGRFDDVVAELAPVRRKLFRFGGSHAQRDVLQRTLLDAAIRSGAIDLAQVLLNERLTLRPTSVYGWTQQARVHGLRGDAGRAATASATAARHRGRFAAASPEATRRSG